MRLVACVSCEIWWSTERRVRWNYSLRFILTTACVSIVFVASSLGMSCNSVTYWLDYGRPRSLKAKKFSEHVQAVTVTAVAAVRHSAAVLTGRITGLAHPSVRLSVRLSRTGSISRTKGAESQNWCERENAFQGRTSGCAKRSQVMPSCDVVFQFTMAIYCWDAVLLQSRISLTSNTFYFTDIANTTFRCVIVSLNSDLFLCSKRKIYHLLNLCCLLSETKYCRPIH